MRRIILTCLLAGLFWGVRAQKHDRMSREQREEAMEVLGMLHHFETEYFATDSLFPRGGLDRAELPWNKWCGEHRREHRRRELLHLFTGVRNVTLRGSETSPNLCEVSFRCLVRDAGNFSSGGAFDLFDDERHLDGASRCTGFCRELFGGLKTDVRLHLTDGAGEPVFLDTEGLFARKGQTVLNEEYSEVWFTIGLPLSVPWEEVKGGHVALQIFAPREYDHVALALGNADAFPCEVDFRNGKIRIEKVDTVGFVLSAADDMLECLSDLQCLYCRDGVWYSPSWSYEFSGDVKTLLKLGASEKLPFGAWLKRKGVDSLHLEKTMGGVLSEDMFSEEDVPWGKRINTGMWGDSLLLYRPVGTDCGPRLVSAVLPVSGGKAEVGLDEERCHALLGQLGIDAQDVAAVSADLSEATEYARYDVAADGLPLMDFARPDDRIEGMDPVVYGLGYTAAHNVMKICKTSASRYMRDYAPALREGYAFGKMHRQKVLERDFSWKGPETDENIVGRYFCLAGMQMAVYGTVTESKLDRVDALIVKVLNNCRCGYNLDHEGEYEAYMYFESLLDEWEEFLRREMNGMKR